MRKNMLMEKKRIRHEIKRIQVSDINLRRDLMINIYA